MKILAIESSALTASAAIWEDDLIVAEYMTNYKKTHSQTLMPMIEEICKMTETDVKTIDAVAISSGPGSFTGLRIGAATAKGFALALNIPLIAVPTLEAMAYNFYANSEFIVPIMDARRDQVYTGIFTFEKEKSTENKISYAIKEIIEPAAMAITELIEKLNSLGKEDCPRSVIFLGDGVLAFKETIESKAQFPYSFAPANLNRQSAAGAAAAAYDRFRQGKAVDAADFAPNYFRLSQAEREAKKNKMA